MRISELLEGIGTSVQFYPDLVPITGSHNATTFLGQLCYWTGKERKPDGWIYKTQEEWELETELSPKEQRVARKLLKQRGLIEDRFIGIPRRLEYRLIQEALDAAWEMWIPAMRIKEQLRSLLAEDAALVKHGIADPDLKEQIDMLRHALKRARTSPEEAETIEKSISDQTALMEVTKRHNKQRPNGTTSSDDRAQLSIQPIETTKKSTHKNLDARVEKGFEGSEAEKKQEEVLGLTGHNPGLKATPLAQGMDIAKDPSSARRAKSKIFESNPEHSAPQYFAEEFWQAWDRYCAFCDDVGADEGFSDIAARVWDRQIEAGISVDEMAGRGMDAYFEAKKAKASRNGGQYIGVPRFENYLGARPTPYWKQALQWKERSQSRSDPSPLTAVRPVSKEPTPEFLGRFEEARSLLGPSVSWTWDNSRDCRVVIISDRVVPEIEFMQMPLDVYLQRSPEQIFAGRVDFLAAMHKRGDQSTLLRHLDEWWRSGWCGEVVEILEIHPEWGVPLSRFMPESEAVEHVPLIQDALAEPDELQAIALDVSDLIAEIQAEFRRLGWTKDQQNAFVHEKFQKRSLQRLEDEDLLKVLELLRRLPTEQKCPEMSR